MSQNLIYCKYCSYTTLKKFNLNRHQYAKHKYEIDNCSNVHLNFPNVHLNCPNVHLNCPNVHLNFPNVHLNCPNVHSDNKCNKCNKFLSSKYKLNRHLEKCNGIDKMTCPKCMKLFSSYQSKCNHIRKNNCKARSIVYAKTPNIQNIDIYNNIDNSININNNIIINNYGSERIDHIDKDKIFNILLSGYKTIPMIVKSKHFDDNFPENNNIKMDKFNQCHIFNTKWNKIDINLLSSSLIEDNSKDLLYFCDKNKEELNNKIQDDEIVSHIKDKIILVKTKSDIEKYNTIHTEIKDLIKNTI